MSKAPKEAKAKKPFYKRWWVWVVAVIIIISAVNTVDDTEEIASTPDVKAEETTEPVELSTEEEGTEEEATEEEATEEVVEEAEPEEEKEPEMTLGQKNAVQKAEVYISMGGFSEQGLKDQLEFESFSAEDSQFAIDHLSPDWNEQVETKAKTYMDMGGFSKDALIEQLKFEGFTDEQANHGATSVGY